MRRSFALLVMLVGFSAHALTIEQPLADPAREAAARGMFQELRCVVCEGQSLAESDAVLAVQMRARIRGMIEQGESPEGIRAYFQSHYGDAILMTPPLTAHTALLWTAPLLLLVAGGLVLRRFTRKNPS